MLHVIVQRIHSSTLLKGSIIKDAVWDDKGFRFFYGDEHGRVAVANVPRVCSYMYIMMLLWFSTVVKGARQQEYIQDTRWSDL